jgi:hypothetical protein
VGKKLVLPMLKLEEFKAKKHLLSKALITPIDFHIAYFRIGFKPGEVKAALQAACDANEASVVVSLLQPLLEQVFNEPLVSEDQFDVARDNLMLAGTVIVHNPIFSSFALQHASKALEVIKKDYSASSLKDVTDMQRQIQSLQEGIKSVNLSMAGGMN